MCVPAHDEDHPDEDPERHEDDDVSQRVVDEALADHGDQGSRDPRDHGPVAAVASALRPLRGSFRREPERGSEADDDQHRGNPRLRAPGEPEVVRVQRVDGACLGAGAQARDGEVSGPVPDPRPRLDLADRLRVDLLAIVVRAREGDRADPLGDHPDLRVAGRKRADQPRHDDHRGADRDCDRARFPEREEQIDEGEDRADPGAAREREHEARDDHAERQRRAEPPETGSGAEREPDGGERAEVAERAELIGRPELAREPVVHLRRAGDRLQLAEVGERPADQDRRHEDERSDDPARVLHRPAGGEDDDREQDAREEDGDGFRREGRRHRRAERDQRPREERDRPPEGRRPHDRRLPDGDAAEDDERREEEDGGLRRARAGDERGHHRRDRDPRGRERPENDRGEEDEHEQDDGRGLVERRRDVDQAYAGDGRDAGEGARSD